MINSERYLYTFERIGLKLTSASCVLRISQRDISIPLKELVLTVRLLLVSSLTQDEEHAVWQTTSAQTALISCLHLFFSPVVTAPQRNSRSWLTWLTLSVSSSCSMWCTAMHPRTQRTDWIALTALTPVSSTAGPVENTASGTADSSTTLGETQVCFSQFKHPTLHASRKLHGSLIIQHLLQHSVA